MPAGGPVARRIHGETYQTEASSTESENSPCFKDAVVALFVVGRVTYEKLVKLGVGHGDGPHDL